MQLQTSIPDQSPPRIRKTRVLCCASSLDGGGSERQLWQLVNNLDRSRFAPQLYLLYRRGPYLEKVAPDVPIEAFWDNRNPNAITLPGQIFRSQLRHLRDYVRVQGIDVVYDRTFHSTMLTGTALARSSVKRISVIVSPPSHDFGHSELRFQAVKRWLLRRAYRSATQVVAVSEDVADDAAKFYRIDRASIVVSLNPINCQAVRAAAEAPLDIEFDDNPDILHVAVVGRLSSEKGQRLAIEATAQLARKADRKKIYQLHLVGEGIDRLALEQLARSLGISNRVLFHGFLQNPYPLIKRCDLVCIPSSFEGLPNIALESLLLETPLVATDCSRSLRNLLGDDERGMLVPMHDVEQLAAAFISRTAQPLLWKERAAAGRIWVGAHHSLEPWLESTQLMLENTLDQRAVRS